MKYRLEDKVRDEQDRGELWKNVAALILLAGLTAGVYWIADKNPAPIPYESLILERQDASDGGYRD